jgi:GT2 family glycosyltransferase
MNYSNFDFKVICIVVTYNGERWIDHCLSSLQKSNLKIETIIIDNGSTDNTCEIIKNRYSDSKLIQSIKNNGFGEANNIGLRIALEQNADYVFLLNQDAWIELDTIEKLIEAQRNNPEFDIVSPIHLNGSGNELDYLFSTFIAPDSCKRFYSDVFLGKVENKIYETDFVNAAAWLITNNCLHSIGGFSPVFYHYGEDSDYINRLHYHKMKVGIYPKSVIYHDKDYASTGKSTEEWNALYKIQEYSNPNKNEYNITNDINSHLKHAFKSLVGFNVRQFKENYFKFKSLVKLKLKINKHLEQVKLKQASFLK